MESLFSERLRLRMSRLNLQANELAEKLDVAPSAVSNWLAGANCAKGSNLRQLAEALHCDPGWLTRRRRCTTGGEPAPARDAGDLAELAVWKHRALEAEKRLRDLQNGLRSLVELSASASPPSLDLSHRSEAKTDLSRRSEAKTDPVVCRAASAAGRAAKRPCSDRPPDPATGIMIRALTVN